MTHVRQQIREAITTAITGLATTGSRVWDSRLPAEPLQQNQIPAWIVAPFAGEGEELERDAMSPAAEDSRLFALPIIGIATGATGKAIADTLDTMAAELEAAIAAVALAGVTFRLLSTEFDSDTEPAERLEGSITLTYAAYYFTVNGAAELAI